MSRKKTMEKKQKQRPLNVLQIPSLTTTINRSHSLIHSFLLSLFLSHRLPLLYDAISAPLLLLILTELSLSLCWLLFQPFHFRPVTRAAFIDRLPDDEAQLPAVDVLICTADPNKEPTVEVMNTVVSAMALDYPAGKLHVYLSDDGGAAVTLSAMKEAWGFATWWVPFCRRYNVSCRCPVTYFGQKHDDQDESDEFRTHRLRLKSKYEQFKERVEKILHEETSAGSDNGRSRADHPPLVQVVNEECTDPSIINPNHADIPLLVYVAREKRPSYPHHFKAGALNVLLRISGVVSNSPVVLVLDCDMYCNNPTSAKQAMCFYLDEDISPSLSFVQFPQRFHNITKSDIYDSRLRIAFELIMPGLDGLGRGSFLCGSGFYMNRKAIYNIKGVDLVELRNTFGASNDFLMTLNQDIKPNAINYSEINPVIREAEFLASCTYEKDTEWGKEVGFFYHSLVEDLFTGYKLHCRGWKSVYLNPERDPFLGTATTNLNDVLTQNSRWYAGLVEIGLSRFCPLVYGLLGRRLPLLPCICYTWSVLNPLSSILYWSLAIIPPLCLLHGVPLYPNVSSTLFLVSALIFFSSLLKHLQEVLATGGTVVSWWNENRMWMIRMLSSNTYGSLDAILKIMGLKETSFVPTNKVIDDEQANRYQQGLYDFRTSRIFLVPLGTVVIMNMVCFVGGSMRMMLFGNWDEMAAQLFLSGYYLVLSLPFIEGMFLRKDNGRYPTSATMISIAVCLVVMVLGPFVVFN